MHLDVLTFHDGAARALLHGISPYGITYPNPFEARETQAFYGSGLATADRILVGYPYPPVSLLLVLPGYLLGDTRFAMVAAVAVTSLVLHRYVSRSRRGADVARLGRSGAAAADAGHGLRRAQRLDRAAGARCCWRSRS